MQTNAARKTTQEFTAGGSRAVGYLKPIQKLRRSVLSCLLWEDEYYEDGQTIADRIVQLAGEVDVDALANLAIEARTEQNLRHVSLLLLAALAKHGRGNGRTSTTITQVIQRADELSEFLAIYWRNGKTPISKQVKKGLAAAFQKFDAYPLAKYDRAKEIRLRDVMFMVHPKPRATDGIWRKIDAISRSKYKRGEVVRHDGSIYEGLVNGTLPTPDTWETNLSAGADKKATFERLIREGNLGYLALLRNLRNMVEANVDASLVRDAIVARKGGANRVLPFRYIAAARACPQLEPQIDTALQAAIAELPRLRGMTAVLVDVSGSMNDKLSSKSDLSRKDAAAALASIINSDSIRVFSFADRVMELPPRRGMAGVDSICKSQQGATRLFEAVHTVNQQVQYDRIIVITDEQDTTGGGSYWNRGQAQIVKSMPNPTGKGYLINVASNKNGVGYGAWTHIDGFSENVIKWIHELEKEEAR